MVEIKEVIDTRTAQLKAKTRKDRELRMQIHQLTNAMEQKISDLTLENEHLTDTLQESQRNNEEANSAIKQVKKELQAAKQELKEVEIAAANTENAIKTDHERYVQSIHHDNSQIQKKYNEQIEKLKAEVLAVRDTNAANERAITKLEKLVGVHQNTIHEKNEQIKTLEREKSTQLKQSALCHKTEKEDLTQTYETALADLRQQCDANRQELETVSRQLEASEERLRKCARVMSTLKRENGKLLSDIAILRETNDRSLQLASAVGKSTELAAQASMTQKLQEVKTTFEIEKRRLFSVAADEFRTYFNAAETLDERSYRQLLAKVKSELKRLGESDAGVRRLVGAAPGQATDDAIAQFMDCKRLMRAGIS
jgi:chromosome segregation ATPase